MRLLAWSSVFLCVFFFGVFLDDRQPGWFAAGFGWLTASISFFLLGDRFQFDEQELKSYLNSQFK